MYHPFQSFFIRTPHSSFNSLREESFETKILNPQVQEAIYIASPVLYTELQKYVTGTIRDKEEKQRIESSVYRYIVWEMSANNRSINGNIELKRK